MKLSPAEIEAQRKARRAASQRRYYWTNKASYKEYYVKNRGAVLAYQKMYRELNRDAILIKQKIYNDTVRKKDSP